MAMSIVCETGASRLTAVVVSATGGCSLTIGTVCESGAEHAAKTSNVVAPQYAIFLMPYYTVPDGLC